MNIFDSIAHPDKPRDLPDNLIREFFTDEQLKTMYYHSLRVDIPDNNDKAEMLKMLLPKEEFDELGTGTNRIAFLHNGLVILVSLDRRGAVDNWTEMKRSIELPNYLAKTYESNMLINIQQYVNVMDQAQFMANEVAIKEILEDISQGYLFDDIGFTLKNSYNWGYIETENGDELRILDYGYLYPISKKDQEELYRCPKCNSKLKWNNNYTYFQCQNVQCQLKMTPLQMRHRMKLDYEDFENKRITELNNLKMPNLRDIEKSISHIK